jgi:hypothetical protein
VKSRCRNSGNYIELESRNKKKEERQRQWTDEERLMRDEEIEETDKLEYQPSSLIVIMYDGEW